MLRIDAAHDAVHLYIVTIDVPGHKVVRGGESVQLKPVGGD